MPESAEVAEGPPRGRGRAFSILVENPTYRWFFAGQGASLIGTWSQAAAARWIVYEVTQSERAVGVVDAVETLPGVVVGLAAGAVADRVSPRLMLSAMQVGQAVLAFLLAVLVAGGKATIHIWQLALILALSQIFVTFEEPSRQVFQRRLVGKESLSGAIALESGLFNVSRVLGPAMAGLCLSLIGWAAPFALNGFSFFAALAILLWIRTPPRDAEETEAVTRALRGEDGGFMAGVRYIRDDRRVLRIFALLGFFGVAGMGYTALIPAYTQKLLHAAEAGYSAIQVGGGLGSTAGALLVAALVGMRRRDRLVPAGMILAGGSLALAAVVPSLLPEWWALAAAVACMFVNGLGAIVVFASAQTLIQEAVPDALRGRVVGLWMIVYAGSFPIGSLAAGLLARPLGVVPIMLASALACVGVAVVVALSGSIAGGPDRTEGGAS